MAGSDILGNVIMEQWENEIRKRGQVNVLIAGRTGVGKSTLINAIFQGNLAQTGQGKPVTLQTREIKKEGIPLSIFDTRGLELADFQATLKEVISLVSARRKQTDPREHIHVAWVCISEDSRRVEQAEIDLVTGLAEHLPVAGVITKSRADNGFRAEVQRLLPQAKNIIRVRALSERFDDGHALPPMGLVELTQLTSELIPEGQRNALAAAQKVDLQAKINRGHKVVAGAAAAAAVTGATPIPFSDAVVLIPIQIGMLAGITLAFGLQVSKGFLMTLVTSAAGCTGATFVGRAIVANLLKFIPGAGSVAGGVISATTAAALTTALGEAYIAVLAKLSQEKPLSEITEAEITEALKSRLKGNG